MKKGPGFTHGVNYVLPDKMPRAQSLKVVRKGYLGYKENSVDLPSDSPGAHLLRAFDTIFKKSGTVSEGILTDVIWGLRQSADFHDDMIGAALTQLRAGGYIYYSGPDGVRLGEVELIESGKPIWLRYTDKFLNCFAAI